MGDIEKIIEIIQDYFGDRSRTKRETLGGLEEIQTEIESMVSCLLNELEDEEDE